MALLNVCFDLAEVIVRPRAIRGYTQQHGWMVVRRVTLRKKHAKRADSNCCLRQCDEALVPVIDAERDHRHGLVLMNVLAMGRIAQAFDHHHPSENRTVVPTAFGTNEPVTVEHRHAVASRDHLPSSDGRNDIVLHLVHLRQPPERCRSCGNRNGIA